MELIVFGAVGIHDLRTLDGRGGIVPEAFVVRVFGSDGFCKLRKLKDG